MLNINNIDNLTQLEKSKNNTAPLLSLFGQCSPLVDKAYRLLIKSNGGTCWACGLISI